MAASQRLEASPVKVRPKSWVEDSNHRATIMPLSNERPPRPNSFVASANLNIHATQGHVPPELFIIVRPPPSSTNHPFNLQIQFIAPRPPTSQLQRNSSELSRSPSDTPSTPTSGLMPIVDATVESSPTTLTRSISQRSNRSNTSLSSSNASTLGTGRRVTPLYTLNYHSVLHPTTVTDSGTDAKVAKFLKKGVEILGLVTLEPSTLCGNGEILSGEPTPPDPFESKATTAPAEAIPMKISPITPFAISQVTTTLEAKATSIVGKLKRFSTRVVKVSNNSNVATSPVVTTPTSDPTTPVASTKSHPLARTGSKTEGPLALFRSRSPDSRLPTSSSTNGNLAELGGTVEPSTAKKPASGYVWSVRKWSRKDLESTTVPELTLEWKKRKGLHHSGPAGYKDRAGSTTSSLHIPFATHGTATPESERSHSPVSFTMNSRDPSVSGHESEDLTSTVSEDESDPEDSETPWSCYLHLNSSRTLLANLKPAILHPKLVASIAIPSTLLPLPLTTETTLSVEEMKDLMAVTSLWLVIRENLGGVAKKRKGDGTFRIAR